VGVGALTAPPEPVFPVFPAPVLPVPVFPVFPVLAVAVAPGLRLPEAAALDVGDDDVDRPGIW
jgi:hypothetical protein